MTIRAPIIIYKWGRQYLEGWPRDLRTWAWKPSANLRGQDQLPAGKQNYDLVPSQQPPEQIQLHSWQWSYNQNLIGKDRLPIGVVPGEPIYDLPPRAYEYHAQLRDWRWSYNLNLIGKDKLPVGEISTALPPAGPSPPVQTWLSTSTALTIAPPTPPVDLTKIFRGHLRSLPEQQQVVLTWFNATNIALTAQPVAKPFAQYDWSLTPAAFQPERTVAASYNKNLVGQDKLPTGEQVSDLTQRAPEYHVQLRAWTWSYNLNLIGKDRLPIGESVTDLTARPYEYHVQLRSWQWSYNLNLVGQDRLPFRQSDWPNPQPVQWYKEWQWSYNLNLVGQDRLPTGEIITDRPALLAPALFQTWITNASLALTTAPTFPRPPFNQFDWPLTPAAGQPAQSFTASYNRNLVGQDQLPNRQQDWQNPVPLQWYRDWSINLLESTLFVKTTPFAQYDWPVPVAPLRIDETFAASFNKNLIGQDRLPNRQQDWPLSLAAAQSVQTWIQSVNIGLLTPAGPLGSVFNQYTWPLTLAVQQPDRFVGASYNKNLIGQDRLPNRQADWPLPNRGPQQPDRGFSFFNPNYYPPTPPPPALGVPHNLHFHATLGRLKSF
jgi:hypothetical protein